MLAFGRWEVQSHQSTLHHEDSAPGLPLVTPFRGRFCWAVVVVIWLLRPLLRARPGAQVHSALERELVELELSGGSGVVVLLKSIGPINTKVTELEISPLMSLSPLMSKEEVY